MTAPTSTVSATWSRGLSFRERRGAAAPPVDAQLAERRFARWRSQPPFGDADLFATRLFTSALPAPDLVIRTSGEHRLSNFLLWQSAYAELLFVDTLWPDFDRAALIAALNQFAARERRFGALDSEAVA